MARPTYRCWKCGARHYAGSGRAKRCNRTPIVPIAAVGVIVMLVVVTRPGLLTRSPTDEPGSKTAATVTRVVDGDTLDVRAKNGKVKRVRILGINTPEVGRAGEAGECYADPAAAKLADLVDVDQADQTDQRVALIRDPTQDNKDAYGRLLRYVEVAGEDVGAALLRAGAARTRDDTPPVQRQDRYLELEDAARAGNRGLWAACG